MGNCCGKKSGDTRPQPAPQPVVQRPQPVAPPPVTVLPPKLPTPIPTPQVEEEVAPVQAAIIDPRLERIEAIHAADPAPFFHKQCTVSEGATLIRPCFEYGLVYLIRKDDSWYVYNDTPFYEADVDCRFGPDSTLRPGPATSLTQTEDGWHSAHVVVRPLQTELLASGQVNGYKCAITARLTATGETPSPTCTAELAAVKELMGDDDHAEERGEQALTRCVRRQLPFVDLDFPPTAAVLCRADMDGRQLPAVTLQRPGQYLPAGMQGQASLFTGPLVPHAVEQGYLGDSWLAAATAVLAEREEAVRALFGLTTPEEEGVGGYRVVLNKNGWWHTVLVDDYLPTCSGVPIFARSVDDPRELWVSLLQKAYAKVHGSYAAITGGDSLQALQDLTGFAGHRFNAAWAEAATAQAGNNTAACELAARLEHYRAEGYVVLLGTPSESATSYLAQRRTQDKARFAARYAAAGLRCGHSYHLERVRLGTTPRDTWLQLRIPGKLPAAAATSDKKDAAPWIASAGHEWRSADPSGALAFEAELDAQRAEGLQWITLEDALNYFDGGAVLYATQNVADYRVKGVFDATTPSVVLQIRAAATLTAPIEVTFTLSQPDKRGVAPTTPQGLYAPIMLSIASCCRTESGETYHVECNSSDDAERPCTAQHFAVARDVALRFTVEPGKTYVVIPRIHPLGVSAGYARPYALGLLSAQPLENKLGVQFCHIRGESSVLHNVASFAAEDMHPTVAQHQRYSRGVRPVVTVSYRLTAELPEEMPQQPADGVITGTAITELKEKLLSSTAQSEDAISDAGESNTQAIMPPNQVPEAMASAAGQDTFVTALPSASAEMQNTTSEQPATVIATATRQ